MSRKKYTNQDILDNKHPNFLTLRPNYSKCDDKYWDELRKCIEHPDFYKHLFTYYMRLDISDFDHKKKPN